LFFQALFLRSGGTDGPSVEDLSQNAAVALSTADVLALLASSASAADQQPGAELREKVSALVAEVDALKQGSML
jgi:hypothetical protein